MVNTATEKLLACGFCALIIVFAWVICFLPTVFYKNPVEMSSGENDEANVSLLAQLKPAFPCNPPLIFSNQSGFCKPPCDWLSFSHNEQRGMAITDWLTAILCTTCFCVVFATWLKLPEFMKFPHFIIALMAGMSAFIEIIVVIPMVADRATLFCSNVFLDDAFNNPTAFCKSQGVFIHYTSLLIGELFAVYNAVLLKHLVIDKLPRETYSKTFLSSLFIVMAVLPLLPVMYVLMVGGGYSAIYLRYCFPRNADEGYFSCLLPQQMFLGFGTTCLLLVIFKLIKERKSILMASPIEARRRQIQMQKIAVQFIIVIVSYVICVFLSYGVLCIQLNNRKANKISLEKYFQCLIFGKKCPEDYREYEPSYGLIILFLLAGNVFQGGTLTLVMGKQKARNLWRSWLFRLTAKCRPKWKRATNGSSSCRELHATSHEEKNDSTTI